MKTRYHVGLAVEEMPQDDCIFCKIVSGEIPCSKVYEDESILAFLDINPFTLGHTLVIPKQHCATLLELPEELDAKVMRAMRIVSSALLRHTQAPGLNCLQNNYPASGQVVPHLHWHLIPRYHGEPKRIPGRHAAYENQEVMQELANGVKKVTKDLLADS